MLLAVAIWLVFGLVSLALFNFLHLVSSNEATLSGLELVTTILQGPGSSASTLNKVVKPKPCLALGGGFPSIPADLLNKVLEGSWSLQQSCPKGSKNSSSTLRVIRKTVTHRKIH